MGRSIALGGDPKGTGGNVGKRVSSGYNRRRRLATRSSGKQQAGRTAVRTAPIVCPEESPQCARRRKPLPCPRRGLTRRLPEGVQGASGKPPGAIPCPGGLDAPTPARIGTCRPKGRSHFSFGGERKVCKRKPAARRLQRRPAPLRVIRKYRRSGHCRARPLYLLRPVSR